MNWFMQNRFEQSFTTLNSMLPCIIGTTIKLHVKIQSISLETRTGEEKYCEMLASTNANNDKLRNSDLFRFEITLCARNLSAHNSSV